MTLRSVEEPSLVGAFSVIVETDCETDGSSPALANTHHPVTDQCWNEAISWCWADTRPSVSIFPVNCKYFIRSSGAVWSGDIMFMASLTISHLFVAAAAVNCSLNILIVCCWWWWTQARFLNTPTSDTDEIWTVGDFCYNQSQTINNKSK